MSVAIVGRLFSLCPFLTFLHGRQHVRRSLRQCLCELPRLSWASPKTWQVYPFLYVSAALLAFLVSDSAQSLLRPWASTRWSTSACPHRTNHVAQRAHNRVTRPVFCPKIGHVRSVRYCLNRAMFLFRIIASDLRATPSALKPVRPGCERSV
ncbi:hypothetical protein TRVL_08463 [Trypanosoma vivax]|nr:hypothetical protein TRVL_08463 [Trypanosoma vivax]